MSDDILTRLLTPLPHGWPLTYLMRVHLETERAAAAAEIERLRGVIAQHNLCHDLHGKVNCEDFAKGCEAASTRQEHDT